MKPTTLRRNAKAECRTWGKTWSEKNAQAVAADHHRRKGHAVRVETTHVYLYGSRERQERGDGPLFEGTP